MTRINVVPPSTLHYKHLVAEYREIVRPFALVREQQRKGMKPHKLKIPEQYVLGTGHVTFFYDKLQYLLTRYQQLIDEMKRRGYNPNHIPSSELVRDIDSCWFNDYVPTPNAVKINQQRILERMPKEK